MRHSYRPAIPPKPQPYRTQVFDHLGLVAGMFAELGTTEVIDRATKQDPERRVCPTFYTSGNSASCRPFSRKSATSKERYFIAW